MNARDYLDWSRISGLYLRNISHVDRYRTYQPVISPAGLITVIIGEFLENTDPVIDVATWRTHCVYEMGTDRDERISLTGKALDAIGAGRMAEAVRTAQSQSPFDKITELFASGNLKGMDDLRQLMQGTTTIDLLNHMRENVARAMPDLAEKAGISPPQAGTAPPVNSNYESREQIEHLLERYVIAHRSELQHDLNRHGDPRQEPGYTRENRLEEIENLRKRMYAAEQRQQDIVRMKDLMDQIGQLTGNPGEVKKKTQVKLEQLSRELKELVKPYRNAFADDVTPEFSRMLTTTEAFMAARPDVFKPKLVDDKLMARLETFGEYDVDRSGGQVTVEWDCPARFHCDWVEFRVTLIYPKKTPQLLEPLLDVLERVRQQASRLFDDWRRQILASFRDIYQPQMGDWEFEDYEVDDNGEATEASILGHVEGAQIILEIGTDDDSIHSRTFFMSDGTTSMASKSAGNWNLMMLAPMMSQTSRLNRWGWNP